MGAVFVNIDHKRQKAVTDDRHCSVCVSPGHLQNEQQLQRVKCLEKKLFWGVRKKKKTELHVCKNSLEKKRKRSFMQRHTEEELWSLHVPANPPLVWGHVVKKIEPWSFKISAQQMQQKHLLVNLSFYVALKENKPERKWSLRPSATLWTCLKVPDSLRGPADPPQREDPIAATRTMTTSTSVWYRQAPEPSQAAIMAQSRTAVLQPRIHNSRHYTGKNMTCKMLLMCLKKKKISIVVLWWQK